MKNRRLPNLETVFQAALIPHQAIFVQSVHAAQNVPFFDLYVSSTSCRYRKPNIKGLCDIAVYFGIKPDEMIFIGDERKDVLVANDFGCTSVYIDRYNNNRDFGQKFTVKDLNGFYDIVTKL